MVLWLNVVEKQHFVDLGYKICSIHPLQVDRPHQQMSIQWHVNHLEHSRGPSSCCPVKPARSDQTLWFFPQEFLAGWEAYHWSLKWVCKATMTLTTKLPCMACVVELRGVACSSEKSNCGLWLQGGVQQWGSEHESKVCLLEREDPVRRRSRWAEQYHKTEIWRDETLFCCWPAYA